MIIPRLSPIDDSSIHSSTGNTPIKAPKTIQPNKNDLKKNLFRSGCPSLSVKISVKFYDSQQFGYGKYGCITQKSASKLKNLHKKLYSLGKNLMNALYVPQRSLTGDRK